MSWHKLGNKIDKDSIQKVEFEKIISKKADTFKDIIGSEIEKDVQYRFVSTKSFNPLNVLKFVDNTYEIEEIFLVVYRMNLKAVNFFKNFIDERKIPTIILLSSFFKENKKYERWCKELIDFASESGLVEIKFKHTHAKIFICKTKCKKNIVFEGSGNFSDNARIEQYLFENNELTYNFHKKWIQEI
jgi:hypothetical protein